MVTRPAGELSVFFSMPWCCVLSAVLSFISLGSAAAARVALMKLMLPLFGAFGGFSHLCALARLGSQRRPPGRKNRAAREYRARGPAVGLEASLLTRS